MKRVFATLVLLWLAAPAAHAQGEPAGRGARLVDSFGAIQVSDLLARLDNFAVE